MMSILDTKIESLFLSSDAPRCQKRLCPVQLLLLCVGLYACTSSPELSDLAAATDQQALTTSTYYGGLSIGNVQVNPKANPLGIGQPEKYFKMVSPDSLRQAVNNSLRNARLLSSEGESSPYSLDVRFISSEAVEVGTTAHVNSVILYSVMDRQTGESVFTEVITGTLKNFHLLGGPGNLSIAFEGSVQDSLAKFINRFLEAHH
jgi:hypothetical protein